MAGILVVAEHFDGLLRDVTLEMIDAAAVAKAIADIIRDKRGEV